MTVFDIIPRDDVAPNPKTGELAWLLGNRYDRAPLETAWLNAHREMYRTSPSDGSDGRTVTWWAIDGMLDDMREHCATVSPWMYVATQHVRTARWEEAYWLVVREQNTSDLYGLEFREGLTEEQETAYPWEDARGPLPLTRLYPHTVTTVEYRTEAA